MLITKHVRTWLDFLLLWTSKNVINLKRTNRLQHSNPNSTYSSFVCVAPPSFSVSSFVSLFGLPCSFLCKVFWRRSSFENYSKNMVGIERQYKRISALGHTSLYYFFSDFIFVEYDDSSEAMKTWTYFLLCYRIQLLGRIGKILKAKPEKLLEKLI